MDGEQLILDLQHPLATGVNQGLCFLRNCLQSCQDELCLFQIALPDGLWKDFVYLDSNPQARKLAEAILKDNPLSDNSFARAMQNVFALAPLEIADCRVIYNENRGNFSFNSGKLKIANLVFI